MKFYFLLNVLVNCQHEPLVGFCDQKSAFSSAVIGVSEKTCGLHVFCFIIWSLPMALGMHIKKKTYDTEFAFWNKSLAAFTQHIDVLIIAKIVWIPSLKVRSC